MEEKKFVTFKKEELGVKEFIKHSLGKGRISNVSIEYTPVGEKIVISTNKPGLIIGRGGEKIDELTRFLKKRFKLDNPHVEIREITEAKLDAQLVADDIAISLERQGSLRFKVIAYRTLQDIMKAGAMGAEIVLSGKLPSERAKSWRFAEGYLKKTGDPSKVVNKAFSQATTISGVVGIKISILPPNAHIHDRVVIDEQVKANIKTDTEASEEKKPEKVSKKKKTSKKKNKENKK
jgi:small subunit ribosomal protein S3